MSSDIFLKLISKDLFFIKDSTNSMFFLKEPGIICKICHWFYVENKPFITVDKLIPFITIPATPSFCGKLINHKKSNKHKKAYGHYIKCNINNILNNNNSNNYKKSKNEKSRNFIEFNNFNNIQSNSFFNKNNFSNVNLNDKKSFNECSKRNYLIDSSKENFTIILWMIQNNIPLFKLASLHKLINIISNNNVLYMSSHNSSVNIKEYLSVLYENHKNIIINSVQNNKYFSIMVDDSVDISNINQMSIFIRYIDNSHMIKTNFLAVREVGINGATAENFYNILLSVLDEFKLNFKNLVALCGDGAKNISGKKKGLSSLIKEKNQYLINTNCYSHQFNLIIKSLFKIFEMNEIKNKIYKISKYINTSSNRLSLFYNIQNEIFSNQKKKKIILPTDIRWSSLYNSIQSIIDNFLVIKIFFERLDLKKKRRRNKRFY
jgi:hypothetical protein